MHRLLVLLLAALTVVALSAIGTAGATANTPLPPAAIQAIPGDGVIHLAWGHSFSDGGAPITSYQVWRGTSQGAETLEATIDATNPPLGSYVTFDDAVANCVWEYYFVRPVNAVGASTWRRPEVWSLGVPVDGC